MYFLLLGVVGVLGGLLIWKRFKKQTIPAQIAVSGFTTLHQVGTRAKRSSASFSTVKRPEVKVSRGRKWMCGSMLNQA